MSAYTDDQSVLWAHLSCGQLLQAYIAQPEASLQLINAAGKARRALPKAEHGVCFIRKGRVKLWAL